MNHDTVQESDIFSFIMNDVWKGNTHRQLPWQCATEATQSILPRPFHPPHQRNHSILQSQTGKTQQ